MLRRNARRGGARGPGRGAPLRLRTAKITRAVLRAATPRGYGGGDGVPDNARLVEDSLATSSFLIHYAKLCDPATEIFVAGEFRREVR